MKTSIKSIALNYGLYLGIILILLTGIAYATNLDLFLQIWFGLLFLAATIAMGVTSVVKSKKALGGYISFKDAFTAFFITLAVGGLINTIMTVIIFNVIDPDAAIELQEKVIAFQTEKLESYNVPDQKIDTIIAKMEAKGNLYAPANLLQSFVLQIAGFSIVGLIVAAILKKREPSGI